MRIDDEIRDRFERSLRNVDVPQPRLDPVIARGRRLRRRHRAVGAIVAGIGIVALIVPLALLWPLRARDEGRGTGPASEPGRLEVSARVPIGPGITDVATGFGSVWVTGNNGVTRVDPETGQVVAETDVPGTGDYSHIAVGEGSVWVTAPELRRDGSRGNLVRIDPTTNEIAATVHIGGPIEYLAVGGGSVWVTEPTSGGSTVFRIDPRSEQVVGDVEVDEGAGPVVYGFGSIWVNNTWGGGSVTRIDATTGEVVASLDAPSAQAIGDGSLWGATGDSVLRIDPESGTIQATIPIARAQSVALDGSTAWVLVSPRSSDPELFEPIAGTAAVAGIDPVTDRVIGEPVALQDLQPIALAADDRGAWVADYYDGFLSRITAVL
jgi:sugar lactone lactonase YvrE